MLRDSSVPRYYRWVECILGRARRRGLRYEDDEKSDSSVSQCLAANLLLLMISRISEADLASVEIALRLSCKMSLL